MMSQKLFPHTHPIFGFLVLLEKSPRAFTVTYLRYVAHGGTLTLNFHVEHLERAT